MNQNNIQLPPPIRFFHPVPERVTLITDLAFKIMHKQRDVSVSDADFNKLEELKRQIIIFSKLHENNPLPIDLFKARLALFLNNLGASMYIHFDHGLTPAVLEAPVSARVNPY